MDYRSYPTIPSPGDDENVLIDPSLLQQTIPIPAEQVPINPAQLQQSIPIPATPQAPAPATVPVAAPKIVVKPKVSVARASVSEYESAPNPGAPLGDDEYTTESVKNLDREADIVRQQSDIDQQAADDTYWKQQQAADEKIKQSEDYQNNYNQFLAQHEEDAKRVNAAYNESRAGTLKDPKQQFFEDSPLGSVGGRIAAGVAAFASGLGAGLLKENGNPFLDYLNTQIAANFEAHKQNIKDLYDKQVAAGKIADTNQNWAMFSANFKLKGYELASAHIEHELSSIKERSTGQTTKLVAEKGILGLEQQKLALRHELAQKKAELAAKRAAEARAAEAAREAKQKEIIGHVMKAYEQGISNGLSSEEASNLAARAGQVAGYSNQELADVMSGVGAVFDPKQDKFVVPEVKNTKKEKPSAEQEKVTGALGVLKQVRTEISKLPKTVYTPETQHIGYKAGKAMADYVHGEGAWEKDHLTTQEIKDSQAFQQARSAAAQSTSVLFSQGAMSDSERRDAQASIMASNSPEQLTTAIERNERLLQAKSGSSQGSGSTVSVPQAEPDYDQYFTQ